MDELVSAVKDTKITVSNPSRPAPAIHVTETESKQVDWENSKNIVDFTEKNHQNYILCWQFGRKTPIRFML